VYALQPGGGPDATLLTHASPMEIGPYLEHMRTEDTATVAAQVFEVVEEPERR
jgi:hypothetical protein